MEALKDALKSFVLVWLFTTVGLFIPGMLGWINEVTQWANQPGAPAFPDPSNLAYLFVAALTAAFPAAVAGIVRYVENVTGKGLLPRTAAAPVGNSQPGEVGFLDTRTAAVVALVLVVIVILILVF
jgi:hypothetical protein